MSVNRERFNKAFNKSLKLPENVKNTDIFYLFNAFAMEMTSIVSILENKFDFDVDTSVISDGGQVSRAGFFIHNRYQQFYLLFNVNNWPDPVNDIYFLIPKVTNITIVKTVSDYIKQALNEQKFISAFKEKTEEYMIDGVIYQSQHFKGRSYIIELMTPQKHKKNVFNLFPK